MKYINTILELKGMTVDTEEIQSIERLGLNKGWDPERSYIHMKNGDTMLAEETCAEITAKIKELLK